MKKDRLIDKVIVWLIAGLVFFLPLFFLPLTIDFFEFPKNILLFGWLGLLLVTAAIKVLVSKKITLVQTRLDLPILLFSLIFVAATIFVAPNKTEALLSPGGTGTILALTFLYFFIANFSHPESPAIATALRLSGVILALLFINQVAGLTEQVAPWQFLQNRAFTPAGGVLSLATFLLVILPLSLQRNWRNLFNLLISLFILAGLAISIWQLLIVIKPSFLPFRSGWVIAIEAFKNSPLLGVGPANFLSAFTRFKPVFFNQSPSWNFNFGISSNYYLQLLTTVGALGLAAWLFLVSRSPHQVSVWVAFLIILFLPANFLLLFTLFCLMAVSAKRTATKEISLKNRPAVSMALASSLILLAVAIFYSSGRALAAEIYYRKSLEAAVQNLGGQTYNFQIKAIELNPYKSSFRLAYSQTNLALANSLAVKEELTDQERQTISQLIQQAIREAKMAVSLNPSSSLAWGNLARLYHNLINLAQGADQWALSAYQNTIRLNPSHPGLRLDLGGLYYGLNNFEAAADQFKVAVSLKPDLANAYYNLAAAYREQEKYAEAYQMMQSVISLVPPDSADWQKAKEELDELAEKLPAPEAAVSEEEVLTGPEPLPSPVMEKPLELPEESGPEESGLEAITPTPSPEPTP